MRFVSKHAVSNAAILW